MERAAAYLQYLAVKSNLNDAERHVVLGATHAIKENIVRAGGKEFHDAGTGTGRRFSPKELLSEAERVLIRAQSGMSLLERLRRDSELRKDIRELLEEMANSGEPDFKVGTSGIKRKDPPEKGDATMKDVVIRTQQV